MGPLAIREVPLSQFLTVRKRAQGRLALEFAGEWAFGVVLAECFSHTPPMFIRQFSCLLHLRSGLLPK
jgi:hypothetical protein